MSSLARRIPGGTGFGIVVILLIALVALNIFVNPARYAPVGLATNEVLRVRERRFDVRRKLA